MLHTQLGQLGLYKTASTFPGDPLQPPLGFGPAESRRHLDLRQFHKETQAGWAEVNQVEQGLLHGRDLGAIVRQFKSAEQFRRDPMQ